MIIRASIVSLLLVTSALLSACGGGTAMFRENPAHTGLAKSSAPTALNKLVWKFSAPDKIIPSTTFNDIVTAIAVNHIRVIGTNDIVIAI